MLTRVRGPQIDNLSHIVELQHVPLRSALVDLGVPEMQAQSLQSLLGEDPKRDSQPWYYSQDPTLIIVRARR
jgi:hypothetical protein